MNDNNNDILKEFTWSDISIQKDTSNNCFLILATTEERAKLIYDIISISHLKLEVHIEPITKIYTINLVFRYNETKEIEYSYDTRLTSEIYPPLTWLTNGTVRFITTGTQSKINPNHFTYKKPLLNLTCLFNPN